jgi:hypothetical protein
MYVDADLTVEKQLELLNRNLVRETIKNISFSLQTNILVLIKTLGPNARNV